MGDEKALGKSSDVDNIHEIRKNNHHHDHHKNGPKIDKRFYLELKYHLIRPDGKDKDPYVVLGIDVGDGKGPQTPAPTLYMDEGDTVEIIFTNKCGFSSALHLHGFDQVGTMYADGAAYITQYPVPHQSSYRYIFKAKVAGSFWYHGHFEADMMDQFMGSLTVRERRSVNPYKGEYYSEDSLLVAGIPPIPSTGGMLYNMFFLKPKDAAKPLFQYASKFVINARTSEDPYIVNMKPGKNKRLRITNGNYEEEIGLTVEGHDFDIIMYDSQYTERVSMKAGDYIEIFNAQRCDLLIYGRVGPQEDNYRINVITRDPVTDGPRQSVYALLNYGGDILKPPVASPIPVAFPDVIAADPHHLNYKAPPKNAHKRVDVRIHSFQGKTEVGETMTNSDLMFKVSINGSPYKAWEVPEIPTIFDYSKTQVNRADFKVGEVVDFVVYNHDVDPHPFHMHGLRFYTLGRGFGQFNPETDGLTLETTKPLRRDTVHVEGATECEPGDNTGECTTDPAICMDAVKKKEMASCNKFSPMMGGKTPSWTVFRVVFDHEGPFLAHCHIASHMQLGLMMVWIVDDNKPGYNNLPDYLPVYTYRLIPRPKEEQNEYGHHNHHHHHESYEEEERENGRGKTDEENDEEDDETVQEQKSQKNNKASNKNDNKNKNDKENKKSDNKASNKNDNKNKKPSQPKVEEEDEEDKKKK